MCGEGGVCGGGVCVCVHVCLAAQLCLTFCDPMNCSPPSFSVHGGGVRHKLCRVMGRSMGSVTLGSLPLCFPDLGRR